MADPPLPPPPGAARARTAAKPFVPPPPPVATPVPPTQVAALDPQAFRGFRPKSSQVAVAPLVVRELTAAVDYTQRFGARAPDPDQVAASLDSAHKWRLVRQAAEAWLSYVTMQDARAWQDALTFMRELEPQFDAAATFDGSVSAAYPGLARFFEARDEIARRSAATRQRNAKAKEAEKAAAEGAESGAEAAPTGRVVTVTG